MKWRLSIWSGAVLIIILVLLLNLFGVIQLDPWGLFGAVVTIFCLWLGVRLFYPEKPKQEAPKGKKKNR